MTSKEIELECPTCSSKVVWNDASPFRPFCSKRCKLVDFGEWANESHRIAGSSLYGESTNDDEFEE